MWKWSWFGVLVGLLACCGTGEAQGRRIEGPKEISLREVRVKEGEYRPGFDILTGIPERGWKGRIDGDWYYFFDLDGNELLEPETDGMALKEYPFVVPVPEILLVKSGQYDVSFRDEKLVLTFQELDLDKDLVKKAAFLTELRIREGLKPIYLSEEGSRMCEKHCDYLKQNNRNRWGGGHDHYEDPALPGFSREGLWAARGSVITYSMPFDQALEYWWRTPWHGEPLVRPHLKVVGVAERHDVDMLYCEYQQETRGRERRPYLHPPDGAKGVPTSFAPGEESPKPIPGKNEAGFGYPIFIRLSVDLVRHKLEKGEVVDRRGREVDGYFSCPKNPSNPQEHRSNSGLALFLPASSLKPRHTYTVRFHFEGKDEPIEWSFTTGTR